VTLCPGKRRETTGRSGPGEPGPQAVVISGITLEPIMTPETVVTALQDRDVMIPLLCSLVAGALIGAERELNRKPAGIRTHTLLCFAAALMTILGLRMAEWVVFLPEGTQ